MDQDSFYEQLPYTLPAQQCSPAYVIFGTGLQECLLAAYKTKLQGKIGLIIDLERAYGSCLKTLTLRELNELTTRKDVQKLCTFTTPQAYTKSNQAFFSDCIASKQFRGYNIDIEPNLFFAESVSCECLKEAEMDKYMDFKLVSNILYVSKGELKAVPLSKGKIFESQDLSLLQKKTLLMSFHKLIKIYHKFMKIEENQNSTKEFDKDFGEIDEGLYAQFLQAQQDYFLPFLTKLVKGNKTILDYLSYIICNYQYNYNAPIPIHATANYTLKGFITSFGKFIKSCGIYGQGPYLYVDNGIGDIPQSFSRIASIYGSTYVLHPKIAIKSISHHQGKLHIETNLSPDAPIVTDSIFYGPAYHTLHSQSQAEACERVLRVVLICQKRGDEQECPAIGYLMNMLPNPVYLFMFDHTSHTCPEGFMAYQFEVILTNDKQEGLVEQLIDILSSLRGSDFRSSIKYVSSLIRTRKYLNKEQTAQEVQLNDTFGIDLDGHFTNFIRVVGEQERYFSKEDAPKDEDEPYGGYDTSALISKLDAIDIHNLSTPIETAHKQQIEQPQVQKEVAGSPCEGEQAVAVEVAQTKLEPQGQECPNPS